MSSKVSSFSSHGEMIGVTMPLSTVSLLLWLMTATCLTHGAVFTNQQLDDVVSFVDSVRRCRGIVGVSVAVVKGDDVWTRGFGTADRGTGEAVSSSHMMGIGSLTKAFTSALLSTFLNNRYSWGTPVKDILGEGFEFVNNQLTQEVTLRDMLTHRTGLASVDLPIMAGSSLNSQGLAREIRHLPVQTALGTTFDYNNYMYGLLGRVVTEVLGGGQPWEDLLDARLLQRLGMSSTKVLGKTVETTDNNVARPYVLLEGREVVESDQEIYRINPQEPAGAMVSSADDMAKFLKMLLNDGRSPTGEQVLDERLFRDMTRAQTDLSEGFRQYFSISSPPFPVNFTALSYGYGWMTGSYRGHKVVWHTGSNFGYNSYLAFLPDLDLGFYICNNGPGEAGNQSVSNKLMFNYMADVLLQETPWLSGSSACQYPEPWVQTPEAEATSPPPVYDDTSFDNPQNYAGRYSQPLYGDVDVVREGGSDALNFRYGHLEGRLFRGEQDEAVADVEGKLAFLFHKGDVVYYLKLKFEPPGQGVFQSITLTGLRDTMVFNRTAS